MKNVFGFAAAAADTKRPSPVPMSITIPQPVWGNDSVKLFTGQLLDGTAADLFDHIFQPHYERTMLHPVNFPDKISSTNYKFYIVSYTLEFLEDHALSKDQLIIYNVEFSIILRNVGKMAASCPSAFFETFVNFFRNPFVKVHFDQMLC